MKLVPKCRHCGSNDIGCDAIASWDADAQRWKLEATYEDYFCSDCESNSDPEWVEMKEVTALTSTLESFEDI